MGLWPLQSWPLITPRSVAQPEQLAVVKAAHPLSIHPPGEVAYQHWQNPAYKSIILKRRPYGADGHPPFAGRP
ncbi:MAG: hypothetical protein U0074_08915 [Kouleothrix sp.]